MSKDSCNPEDITFIYNGIEYDATAYANKHPGGFDFIDNMHKERKDFTEYFKYNSDLSIDVFIPNKQRRYLNLSPL